MYLNRMKKTKLHKLVYSRLRRVLTVFSNHPEYFFLVCAAFFGLLLVFVLPPYRGLDEASHVYRITQLAEGDLFIEKIPGGYGHAIPDNIHRVNFDEFTTNKKSSFAGSFDRRWKEGSHSKDDTGSSVQLFEGSGVYSPLVYLHYFPVAIIEHYFQINTFLYVLLLRVSNLALFIGCIFFAIRLIPSAKWLLTAVALLPMSLHQASTVSGDVLLLSSIILFVAMLVRLLHNNESELKSKYTSGNLLIGIFVTGVLIGGSKPGYIILTGALLVLPASIFGSKIRKLLFSTSMFGIAAGMLVIWGVVINDAGLSNALETFRSRVNHGGTTITASQMIQQTVFRPWETGQLFVNTFVFETQNTLPSPLPKEYNRVPDSNLSNFTGSFGSLNMNLPTWASFLVLINLVVAYLGFSRPNVLPKTKRRLIVVILFVQFVALFLAFWKTWTSISMQHVWGLQGRYYIPLLPLLVLVTPRKSIFSWSEASSKLVLMLASVTPLVIMSLLIFSTFYGRL